MEDALADLEALMVKWKDMVKLAQDLNERLTAASTPAPGMSLVPGAPPGGATTPSTQAVEPEEATFIRSSLAQLGLQMANAPVTQDMVRDERKWYEELAKELASVLEGTGAKGGEGMMRKRGIVALDEVWGGWNRARGVGESLVIHKPQRPLDRCSLSVMENTLLTFAVSQRSYPRRPSSKCYPTCRASRFRQSACAHSRRQDSRYSTLLRTGALRSLLGS